MGALKLELCGAAWCLPGFKASGEATLITTFNRLFASEQRRADTGESRRRASIHAAFGDAQRVVAEIFGSILGKANTDDARTDPGAVTDYHKLPHYIEKYVLGWDAFVAERRAQAQEPGKVAEWTKDCGRAVAETEYWHDWVPAEIQAFDPKQELVGSVTEFFEGLHGAESKEEAERKGADDGPIGQANGRQQAKEPFTPWEALQHIQKSIEKQPNATEEQVCVGGWWRWTWRTSGTASAKCTAT